MTKKRLIGQNPKVGIRPTIDGRQKGVRESLEDQTMKMARSAADLIESSLKHADGGIRFSVKNRLSPGMLHGVTRVAIDGQEMQPDQVTIAYEKETPRRLDQLNPDRPIEFPLGALLTFRIEMSPLNEGQHDIEVAFETQPFGRLELVVRDALNTGEHATGALPRDVDDDRSEDIIRARQVFIKEHTGADLDHISAYSIDPQVTRGNIEHFTGNRREARYLD